MPLRTLLSWARPRGAAQYVWSEGLDSGTFAGIYADRYQKDLPLEKALSAEVLVAFEMNGEPLGRERGGPVRLIVPGWFGTNGTKWLCRLSLQECRAPSPYITQLYNTEDPDDAERRMIPVWRIDVNSMIVHPTPEEAVTGPKVEVDGWTWSTDGVKKVQVSVNQGESWEATELMPRRDFSWQRFSVSLNLGTGSYTLIAKATSRCEKTQAMSQRRNHVHSVRFEVV